MQYDAVQTRDRNDIAIGNANNTIGSTDGLTVFFRSAGGANPQISLYNVSAGETDTTFSSGFSAADRTWHNYGVKFDLANGLIDIYTDKVDRGQINLKTFAGGNYWTSSTRRRTVSSASVAEVLRTGFGPTTSRSVARCPNQQR